MTFKEEIDKEFDKYSEIDYSVLMKIKNKYCLDKEKVKEKIRFCHDKHLGLMRLVKELKLS